MNTQRNLAEKLGKGLEKSISFAARRAKEIILIYVLIIIIGVVLLYMNSKQQELKLATRAWGGFDEQSLTERCYRQERTAMILSLILGSFGVDQFYAHHWPLAVFKLLTFGGGTIWSFIDVLLWMVGGVYGTPGCPGGSSKGWQY